MARLVVALFSLADWVEAGGNAQVLQLRVTPKASRNQLILEPGNGDAPYIKAYVTAVPEDGKANKAVIALLSKALKMPKSSFEIIKGEASRDKVIKLKY